jgi:dihydrofolate reductase
MPNVIAAFNMTLDGNADHTAGVPDAEIHQHYTDLLNSGGTILYGRTTYQLMENYWPQLVKNPSGDKTMDDFAGAIDNINKVLFSRTVKSVDWKNARLANRELAAEVAALKQEETKDIFVGSRSLIIALLNMNMIDELQLCIHPVIAGPGLMLFDQIADRIELQLIKTKTFVDSGAVLLCYAPKKK